jgi:hypothetical protein
MRTVARQSCGSSPPALGMTDVTIASLRLRRPIHVERHAATRMLNRFGSMPGDVTGLSCNAKNLSRNDWFCDYTGRPIRTALTVPLGALSDVHRSTYDGDRNRCALNWLALSSHPKRSMATFRRELPPLRRLVIDKRRIRSNLASLIGND